MQIIDDNTVVVNNSEEFKKALSEENDYNYIYLGNDITLTSGFTINANKTNLIIDGTYNNVKYTYTNNLNESYSLLILGMSFRSLLVVLYLSQIINFPSSYSMFLRILFMYFIL